MFCRVCVIFAGIFLLAARDPTPALPTLHPTSNWTLDYGYDQCTALRTYGDAQTQVTFGVVQAPAGDTYQLFVGRKRRHSDHPEELQATVNFGSGPAAVWILRYANSTGGETIEKFRITASQMAEARSAHSLTLHIQGGQDLILGLADMPELMAGMDKCTADLRNFWNMGEKSSVIAVPARGSVRAVFTDADFPKLAYVRSQEGTSQYLLLIDEKGSVGGCDLIRPSGVPILDLMGCAALQKRARFRPAQDSAGKRIRSWIVTPPIIWRMPGSEALPTIIK